MGRRFDGSFQATSRSQETGWEAPCCPGRAGFRCLGNTKVKLVLWAKMRRRIYCSSLKDGAESQQWDTDPSHRAFPRRLRVAPRGRAAAPCLGKEGSVAGGAVAPSPAGQEMHAWLLIRGFFLDSLRHCLRTALTWSALLEQDNIHYRRWYLFCASPSSQRFWLFLSTQGTPARHPLHLPRKREYGCHPNFQQQLWLGYFLSF